ncbi:hypothetical protein [Xenorhabdus eapokensis]|uniref:Uncharacterized protein n=1 Tax=Xenorhabdus eapokensis TaxID=1873482 RepID=A0A1Q5TH06_9GAMM|nr:hypothetical protein [Xenorhabdus eapokensis]OKO99489.1 hypothetical protein Xedl_03618 [Xenorhabdus eapokensis]
MTKLYDYETVFNLLDEMEMCIARVRKLHSKLDAELFQFQVKEAA